MSAGRDSFTTPIPYYPRRCGIFWWSDGVRDDLRRDFELAASLGVRQLEVSLSWPEFQPLADRVSAGAMRRLEVLLEVCAEHGMRMRFTLFDVMVGHLVHLPHWVLDPFTVGEREVYSNNGFTRLQPRNLFGDRAIVNAQALFVREVVGEFKDHFAAGAWVIGSGLGGVAAPGSAHEYARWLDAVCLAPVFSGTSGIQLWTSVSARDVLQNVNIDLVAAGERGISLVIDPDWTPPWAQGAGAVWLSFLAAYVGSLCGGRVSIDLSRRWVSGQVREPREQSDAVRAVQQGGGAGATAPPLFDLNPGVVRTAPYIRGASWSAAGLIGYDGTPSDAFQVWLALQREPPPIQPLPPRFQRPDPERRAYHAEDVAHDAFEAFVR
jgi:hypothetical protein